jgi:hypothetical protein
MAKAIETTIGDTLRVPDLTIVSIRLGFAWDVGLPSQLESGSVSVRNTFGSEKKGSPDEEI